MKGWAVRVLVAVTALATAGYFILSSAKPDHSLIRLKGHTFQTTVARTAEEEVRGLSGTKSLPTDHAMLFVFEDNTKPGIWMKDMNYPIDIIWLSSNRQVVHMVNNAQPSSFPKTFQPSTLARYVIELSSGTIEKTGITKGDVVTLPSGI